MGSGRHWRPPGPDVTAHPAYCPQMVAQSRNSETFVALCLLTVAGTSLVTQKMGLSDTMGAFLAGVLLSETSYRTQARGETTS